MSRCWTWPDRRGAALVPPILLTVGLNMAAVAGLAGIAGFRAVYTSRSGASKWEEFVVRGSLAEGRLIGFYLAGGVVAAAVGLDRGGDPELDLHGEMAACGRLVSVRARPTPPVLADDRTDLWSLALAAGS